MVASFGSGPVVADGRPWKYLSLVKSWPISAEPTTLPSRSIRLPLRLAGKDHLGDAGHGQRIDQAGDEREGDKNDDGRDGFLAT